MLFDALAAVHAFPMLVNVLLLVFFLFKKMGWNVDQS